MRQDGGELSGVAESSTDGVSRVNVVQLWQRSEVRPHAHREVMNEFVVIRLKSHLEAKRVFQA